MVLNEYTVPVPAAVTHSVASDRQNGQMSRG
jgi:hypothetical protein